MAETRRDNLIYALAFTTLAAVPSITLAAAASSTTFAVPSVATASTSTAASTSSSAAAAASSATAPSPSGLLLGRPAARRRDAAVVARVQGLGHAVAGRHLSLRLLLMQKCEAVTWMAASSLYTAWLHLAVAGSN